MRRLCSIFFTLTIIFALFAACDTTVKISDGTYRVEMAEFDINGYKDYVEFEIKGGKVVSLVANGYSKEDGSLKTESKEIRKMMESMSGTYPEKFYQDLINEYISSSGKQTDVVAGATMSSENFFHLMKFAENAAKSGDTSIRIVELG